MANAGRVIAGSARGIRLAAPGEETRPLADRVKQTLFAVLDPDLDEARVLDLFAGSGAAGIEALSRGAAMVVFVERSRDACRVIERNLVATHLSGGRSRVVRAEVVDHLRRAADATTDDRFDIVLLDPPYLDAPVRSAVLELLGGEVGRRLLTPNARVVTTHDRRSAVPEDCGLLASERQKRFGESTLTFYRRRAVNESR
ncbi:MAG TPA: 16S rRNA (guanine(966)-N(2))-methyltransferase RsmD [Candidatus Limnocylindrales bacterium]|nr:16S rRNA (guanine(966)-N(2))-methyltransferase RsmD [Candidatus Limnocylindrales bacterium]